MYLRWAAIFLRRNWHTFSCSFNLAMHVKESILYQYNVSIYPIIQQKWSGKFVYLRTSNSIRKMSDRRLMQNWLMTRTTCHARSQRCATYYQKQISFEAFDQFIFWFSLETYTFGFLVMPKAFVWAKRLTSIRRIQPQILGSWFDQVYAPTCKFNQ